LLLRNTEAITSAQATVRRNAKKQLKRRLDECLGRLATTKATPLIVGHPTSRQMITENKPL
jgi:hypothetical protein